jgi:hypothetical protein
MIRYVLFKANVGFNIGHLMNRLLITCLSLSAAMLSDQLQADEAKETEETVRKIVGNSLDYIEKRGESWRKARHCHSCHRTTFTIWALNRAGEKGFDVNAEQLKTWNERGRKWESFTRGEKLEKMEPAKVLRDENAAVGQMLLGRPHGENQADWVTLYRTRLLEGQEPAGFWKAGGQLPRQKRPNRETTETNTMWAMIALRDSKGEDPQMKKALQKARKWMGNKTNPISTEWWVTRLLVERDFGHDKKADDLLKTLLSKQNPDGGWGWLTNDKSDAFGTGLALYAFAKEGLSLEHPKLQKAVLFLKQTQRKDGAWEVNGTKKQDRDEPAETAKYWGTTWAVIGLLELLEDG